MADLVCELPQVVYNQLSFLGVGGKVVVGSEALPHSSEKRRIMSTRLLFRLTLLLCLLLPVACSSAADDLDQAVSQAAAATVSALRAQDTPIPRYVEATRVISVTRVIDVTRVIEITRIVDAPERATPTVSETDITQGVVSSPGENQAAVDGWKVSEFTKGTAEFPYPGGEPGELSIVQQGVCRGAKQSVCLTVRNNTNEPVAYVNATGVARVADGSMFAAGKGTSFEPKYVLPGELVFGSVYFGADLPDGVTYDLEVQALEQPARSNAQGDLLVSEASFIKTDSDSYYRWRVVGQLKNTTDKVVTGPIGADVLCFSTDGSWERAISFTDKSEAEPGQMIPFQIQLLDDCPSYLIMASGYTW